MGTKKILWISLGESEDKSKNPVVPLHKSNLLIVDAVFLAYGELFNSPVLVTLYNKYIIYFYLLGCFCSVFIFYLNLKLLIIGESLSSNQLPFYIYT